MRLFDRPGRSQVYSSEAMVATSQPLASSVALNILKKGGNAIDAAISAAAVLAVVEPTDTGIGGDCFVLYAPNGKSSPFAFNGSGRSPKNLSLNILEQLNLKDIPDQSAHAVTIPGAIDAWWQLHEKFGKLEFEELFIPAINYAEEGYPVHERLSSHWGKNLHRLNNLGDAKSIFLKDNSNPKKGERVFNLQLAKSLKIISKKGRKGFYEGEIAEKTVKFLNQIGGKHTLEDFYSHKGNFVNPISSNYRNNTVFQLPPNTQGIITLIILKILNYLNLSSHSFYSAERIHILTEVSKIGYFLRNQFLGDLEYSDKILEIFNDENMLMNFSKKVLPGYANYDFKNNMKLSSDTIYLTVIDKDKNIVSFINSIFEPFGSGLVPPETGIILQNRGKSFNTNINHPNCIAPSKKPMHTIIPGMMSDEHKIQLSFGVMGGDYQPMGNCNLLSGLVDHELTIQEVLDAPRFLPTNGLLDIERSLSNDVENKLKSWGHNINYCDDPLGGGQAISINWKDGIISGGSDPRKDGCAIGY